jgi:hypothetical protein
MRRNKGVSPHSFRLTFGSFDLTQKKVCHCAVLSVFIRGSNSCVPAQMAPNNLRLSARNVRVGWRTVMRCRVKGGVAGVLTPNCVVQAVR